MQAEPHSRSAAVERELFIASFLGVTTSYDDAAALAARLAPNLHDVWLGDGEVLYERGQPSELYYFVVSGQIELTVEGSPSWVLGARSVVGAIDVSLERVRSRTARAIGPVRALALSGQVWMDALEDNFEAARSLILGLAHDLHQMHLEVEGDASEPIVPPHGGAAEPSAKKLEPLNLFECAVSLRAVGCFRRARVQAVLTLAEFVRERRLAAGEVLFAHGVGAGSLFVVAEGAVELLRERPSRRGEFFAGSLAGGPSALTGQLGAYEARATTGARILQLSAEDYWDVMEEHFALVRSAVMSLSEERERLMNLRTARAGNTLPVDAR